MLGSELSRLKEECALQTRSQLKASRLKLARLTTFIQHLINMQIMLYQVDLLPLRPQIKSTAATTILLITLSILSLNMISTATDQSITAGCQLKMDMQTSASHTTPYICTAGTLPFYVLPNPFIQDHCT